MKFKEIKEKSEGELKKILAEKREELRQVRFELYAKQLKENHRYQALKRDIARILTRLKMMHK